MKLGKQVQGEIWQIIKMLQEGEVLFDGKGGEVFYSAKSNNPFRIRKNGANLGLTNLGHPLYHKLKTYKVGVNQVELDDCRVKSADEANDNRKFTYLCAPNSAEKYMQIQSYCMKKSDQKVIVENSLLHTTKEAAIAHTEAMLEVK